LRWTLRHAVAHLEDVASGRNAAEHRHDRRTRRTREPVGDLDALQYAAKVQRERFQVEDEDALVAGIARWQRDRAQRHGGIKRRRIGGTVRCGVVIDDGDAWNVAWGDGRRHGGGSNSCWN
jgi:hypothetical protein